MDNLKMDVQEFQAEIKSLETQYARTRFQETRQLTMKQVLEATQDLSMVEPEG